MQSKRLVRFYDEHCSRTIAKITVCEKRLTELKEQLLNMHEQAQDMQRQLRMMWAETFGKAVAQREIYTLKRKEALILSRHEDLQLQVQETTSSMEQLTERRDDFIKLRLHYEKKKKKWEWMSDNAKKMRIRKDIHRDEKAAEECATWTIQ
ncbi:hypothetical protein C3432_01920 [Citrobacter amalonaticus]|uniref:Uncharacterized protein n=1 Tax=Citrobacter amalonaticus TaxID=35703 RepID=A0A2S4S2J3_CITAM|nr:hypothetical protein [Citrobacter amalonaticus]POT59504.1 hypothetical protein C3432_01920 [Citrobacter amalonaticus]POT77634.1 hypothetical protein C3436_09590 [Citrobacter amalonaticus]POU68086.1 hypothetical protein C3430_03125 [Citrobacter amalonaticus]POV07690.1 hypothetical protein C3424_03135 [Citrobacter amalonaticus]